MAIVGLRSFMEHSKNVIMLIIGNFNDELNFANTATPWQTASVKIPRHLSLYLQENRVKCPSQSSFKPTNYVE